MISRKALNFEKTNYIYTENHWILKKKSVKPNLASYEALVTCISKIFEEKFKIQIYIMEKKEKKIHRCLNLQTFAPKV